ncbi:MAG: putative oxidoreductase C-terminal domain-containing protein [Sedimentisphaerales bacterium]|jgi:predicted dehydrogenase|nr:putative oxidoreductase C-terminal domain-containing protein [Sedimentisphaerales bacterium]HNY77653.1 putative oxidoreductase C-terminal domain-containing protein [Sedimentisphaerales bacterium]HOC61986.1 putative oxidoreductase C-terminal domain-containing protein [Sedimentisphaerales bacterium]HOH63828.1 putative oxidoreductase C-terminal domain-containing protein [Sedimentisphaerales bacterium]HPY50097.1 putative oxidoreductase C-terminal domain-containing protein [Sedimentisphaerales ba
MVRTLVLTVVGFCLLLVPLSCATAGRRAGASRRAGMPVRLIVLDPGHYHAALVQKTMYEQIDPAVHVYAPDGPEVQEYLARVEGFSRREDDPTSWQQQVYIGPDYLKRMRAEKAGVVVLSGNNRRKTEYITAAIDAGLNVFADKPMCIDAAGFAELERAFDDARRKGLLIYDIMTERYNRLCILQRLLMLDKELFGELDEGSPEAPAVYKESTHHFFKYVAGQPIRRPMWYFDAAQQGEGLVDITTHLIDSSLWTCFPGQQIDYDEDVAIIAARRWPTVITRAQYEKVTGAPEFPDYLESQLNDDGALPYYCNGEIAYTVHGVHMKLVVRWDFEAPKGTEDTHISVTCGSRARIVIRQGIAQNYQPELYVETLGAMDERPLWALRAAVARLQGEFPGLTMRQHGHTWQLVIPPEQLIGHEAHFRHVTEQYLDYLAQGSLPPWEVDFMKAKYFITTQALELARQR